MEIEEHVEKVRGRDRVSKTEKELANVTGFACALKLLLGLLCGILAWVYHNANDPSRPSFLLVWMDCCAGTDVLVGLLVICLGSGDSDKEICSGVERNV